MALALALALRVKSLVLALLHPVLALALMLLALLTSLSVIKNHVSSSAGFETTIEIYIRKLCAIFLKIFKCEGDRVISLKNKLLLCVSSVLMLRFTWQLSSTIQHNAFYVLQYKQSLYVFITQ
jgi:hypothetical protein